MQLAKPRINGKRSKTWYLVGKECGRGRRVSTRTGNRAAAERYRAKYEAGLGAPPDGPTIGDILLAYLRDRHSVVACYSRLVEAHRPLAAHFGQLQPAHINRVLIGAYRRDVSPGTRRRELGMLRAALGWAVRENWIKSFPYIPLPPKPAPKDRWLTRQEAESLINAATEHHIRLFLVLALYTAARKGAILELTWDRVDTDRRLIWFPQPGRQVSSKRRAVVPIGPNLGKALGQARELASTNWVIEWKGQPVASVKRAFATARRGAGLGPEVTIHTLRHTAATWMAQEGVEMRQISLLLGHTSTATTERVYAHWSPDYLRGAVAALEGA